MWSVFESEYSSSHIQVAEHDKIWCAQTEDDVTGVL